MVERIRSEYDGDFQNRLQHVSAHKSEAHQQEIRCGVCGRLYFVDDETFSKLERAVKYDLDNPFLCETCEREYQDAAFE